MTSINHSTISEDEAVRPTHVEVDLMRLTENFRAIRRYVAPAKVMPILKANAYGHGLLRIAQLMEELRADYIGVAVLEEGILLREHGIQTPILVLERIGVHYYSAQSLLETALKCKWVDLEGIFSHFANADLADLSDARAQVEHFLEALYFYEKHSLPPPPLRHMANSPAILQLPEARFDMVRPGLLLYGVYPSPEIPHTINVRPALSWKSRVVYFKVIQPGHPVGYGSTWQSDHMVRAVTVPVGYGDGYFRSMSNKARVLLRGKQYPVIGRISMDQIVVNIEWDSAYNDDEVTLIGESGPESIACEDLAEWAGTIPYEILTNINTRVPRIYLGK
jgi:alanine racemase